MSMVNLEYGKRLKEFDIELGKLLKKHGLGLESIQLRDERRDR